MEGVGEPGQTAGAAGWVGWRSSLATWFGNPAELAARYGIVGPAP